VVEKILRSSVEFLNKSVRFVNVSFKSNVIASGIRDGQRFEQFSIIFGAPFMSTSYQRRHYGYIPFRKIGSVRFI
jgi:hypothetical protein